MRVRLFLSLLRSLSCWSPPPPRRPLRPRRRPRRVADLGRGGRRADVDQLAAANGLSVRLGLVAGSTLQIPPQRATVVTATGRDVDRHGRRRRRRRRRRGGAAGRRAPLPPATGSGGSYVVQPGDTLSAIAARAGMSVASLAAANGLDPNGVLISGIALRLRARRPCDRGARSTSDELSPAARTSSSPGDTLSAIAARAGVSVDSLAAANGLDRERAAARRRDRSTSRARRARSRAATSQPVGTVAAGQRDRPAVPDARAAQRVADRLDRRDNGVPPSLADAIGWQESGFNNDLVSSADARGMMQILPGTWDWIQQLAEPGARPGAGLGRGQRPRRRAAAALAAQLNRRRPGAGRGRLLPGPALGAAARRVPVDPAVRQQRARARQQFGGG